MKFIEILEDTKLDSEEYLNEAVIKKGKKYLVVKNNNKDECVPGTKEAGYASLENAVKAMLDQTNSSFKALSFDKKKQRVDNYVKKWKKDNDVKDPKPRRKHGFEQIIFSTDE
jgi:hypothetical protein